MVSQAQARNATINQFFAVTKTSIYLVSASGEKGDPTLKKIARHGESMVPLDETLAGGKFLGITAVGIVLYDNPGSSSQAHLGRVPWPEEINSMWWGGKTSPVAALFLTREEAEKCFNSPDLQEKDLRWLENTKEILRQVGDNHPAFVISGSDCWPGRPSWRTILGWPARSQ